MKHLLALAMLCLLSLAAHAQETADPATTARDRSFLTALIEDNLSGAGRSVRLDGFAGALSSRATFDQLSIADEDGVWITIRNGAIRWNRSALLSGRIEIDEMSAEEIDLPRRPNPGSTPSEARGFSLPDLPVSVAIGVLKADRVALGAPILGVPAEVRLDGSMSLANGEGSADLGIHRIDGAQGELTLSGSYSNSSREAALDLLLKEAEGGIAVELLNIPGRPSAELAIHGSGVIDRFKSDISLRTDGQPRVTGQVAFDAQTDQGGATTRSFDVRLAGDITPLFLPEYREFFGSEMTLEAQGQRRPSGEMDLTRLAVDSRGVDLSGNLSLNAAGLPLKTALTVRIGLPDGSDVLLPVSGQKTLVRSADLKLRYDQSAGDGWTLDGTVSQFRTPSLSIAALTIDGSGRINPGAAVGGSARNASVGGTIRFSGRGIDPADPALAEAIGPAITGKTIFSWQSGGSLRFPVLQITGDGYDATGALAVDGVESGVEITADITSRIDDLARLSALAGRPVGGSGAITLRGSYGLLSGIVDGEGELRGRDISISQAEVDNLLKGETLVSASVRRDEGGTTIRAASLKARTLTASASGQIASDHSDVTAKLDFSDLAVLGRSYRGALSASARMIGPADARALSLTATGDGLGIGQAELDRLIGGKSDLAVSVVQGAEGVALRSLSLKNGELSVEAEGSPTESGQRIALTSRLRDMSLLAPGFPGALTLNGTIDQSRAGFQLDLQASGPGGTNATVEGSAAPDMSTVDLSIRGGAQSAIVNPFIQPRNVSGPVSFDLRMNGAPGLPALSGTVALRDGVLVAPTFGVELRNLAASADLAGQSASLTATANVRGGGRITLSGPVALTPPFNGDLAVTLRSAKLRDPELFDTVVDGSIRVSGPLTGGAEIAGDIRLGRTEVRIPSTGFGSQVLLDNVRHIAEPPAVQQTRRRAGLIEKNGETRGQGRAYGLNVSISAPDRIFVRGRGLDAELGGSLTVSGTTQAAVPSGRFTLVRGRLDILGKRFTIDDGLIELQGALTPYIRFAATTESDAITATIVIEGDATAPEIHFLSTPELPEEEVISQLLFSKSLSNLSAFQAAQLASAVATLAGKGGEGIVSKLRKSFGLDDLDLSSDDSGATTVKLGKYISEKVYTDVAIGSDGKTEVNINLDVRKDLTVRGTLASDGSTGVGLYYERDY